MRVMITGSEGQTGRWLQRLAAEAGNEIIPFDLHNLDLRDDRATAKAVGDARPEVIINAAAYNAVDRAEDEPAEAFLVNSVAPARLAIESLRIGAIIVHYSTNFVFDGTAGGSYTEDDSPNPLSVYARSKLLGERAVLAIAPRSYVLRTAWVWCEEGDNFQTRLLAAADAGRPLRFVDDQVGTPTHARDLAAATLELLKLKADYGLYNAVGSGSCTPYEWASAIIRMCRPGKAVGRTDGSSYRPKAARPARAVLDTKKLGSLGISIPGWAERLGAAGNQGQRGRSS